MNTIYSCVLKGATTSYDQFVRFLHSYHDALGRLDCRDKRVVTMFLVDKEGEEALKNTPVSNKVWFPSNVVKVEYMEDFNNPNRFLTLFPREGDPGDLRNEFLCMVSSIADESDYFTFFDGDDEINPEYFVNAIKVINEKSPVLLLCNPMSKYENTYYPMKWCQSFRFSIVEQRGFSDFSDCIRDLAYRDIIGGQCWGKFYSSKLANVGAKFGQGLFEDVMYWYTIVNSLDRTSVIATSEKSVYYWHRDNPCAITRTTSTKYKIMHGIDNLNFAMEHTLDADRSSKVRRYTVGVITLYRNACKASKEDKEHIVSYMQTRLERAYLDMEFIELDSPKLFETFVDECPEWESDLIVE